MALYMKMPTMITCRDGEDMKRFNSRCPEQYATKSTDVYVVGVVFAGHDNRLLIDRIWSINVIANNGSKTMKKPC